MASTRKGVCPSGPPPKVRSIESFEPRRSARLSESSRKAINAAYSRRKIAKRTHMSGEKKDLNRLEYSREEIALFDEYMRHYRDMAVVPFFKSLGIPAKSYKFKREDRKSHSWYVYARYGGASGAIRINYIGNGTAHCFGIVTPTGEDPNSHGSRVLYRKMTDLKLGNIGEAFGDWLRALFNCGWDSGAKPKSRRR